MIALNTRIPEIDFIKGIAISSVILLHTLPEIVLDKVYDSIHIGQAVPLFLFITFFLSFNRLEKSGGKSVLSIYFSYNRIKRVLKDVALPFFIVVALELLLHIFVEGRLRGIKDLLYGFLGYGPGNYYFWGYIQLWILIPFLYLIMRKHIVGGVFLS